MVFYTYVLKPCFSDHIVYIRASISAQSQLSVPPAPAVICTTALSPSPSWESMFLNSKSVSTEATSLSAHYLTPIARLLARSLATLSQLLALKSTLLTHSLVCSASSLVHSHTHSFAPELVRQCRLILSKFLQSVLSHCAGLWRCRLVRRCQCRRRRSPRIGGCSPCRRDVLRGIAQLRRRESSRRNSSCTRTSTSLPTEMEGLEMMRGTKAIAVFGL